MKNGVSGQPVPIHFALPYAVVCNDVATRKEFPPCLLYAISFRESIGEYGKMAAYKMSDNGDGGHGLCQLTSSYPSAWKDPATNYGFAVDQFLQPAWNYWVEQSFAGDDLVRLVAASFNAGIGGAQAGHDEGDADKYTTADYAANVLRIMHQIMDGETPTL